jgi:hypothetical protein
MWRRGEAVGIKRVSLTALITDRNRDRGYQATRSLMVRISLNLTPYSPPERHEQVVYASWVEQN